MNEEATCGQRQYLEVMRKLHEELTPTLYMEIGVRNGASLSLAKGAAVGVDPKNQLTVTLPPTTVFYERTSDEFFNAVRENNVDEQIDFAFIDGMHLFEYALRDFINIEQYAAPWTVIVFDDVCPNHPLQAARDRTTNVWTGDVWKLRDCLRRYRPDLVQIVLDTWPSGLMLVLGLDKNNRVLSENYEQILQEYVVNNDAAPPAEIVQRDGVLPPTDELVDSICAVMRKVKAADAPLEEIEKVKALMAWRFAL